MPNQLAGEERFKVEYAEVGNLIRHFSNVRSALTTFLLTVGVAAFSAYFQQPQSPSCYFLVVGGLFLVISVAVCLVFSYRTERMSLYQTELWKWSNGDAPYASGNYPAGFKSHKPSPWELLARMRNDPMNWFLIGSISGILLFVCCLLRAGT